MLGVADLRNITIILLQARPDKTIRLHQAIYPDFSVQFRDCTGIHEKTGVYSLLQATRGALQLLTYFEELVVLLTLDMPK